MLDEYAFPTQLTTFVGRVDELRSLGSALTEARLVTITGPGGCGKTRLAAEVASAGADTCPDGVRWVDLTATSDPAAVIELVADACDTLVASNHEAPRSLARQLAQARLLVCLDNCEHLLETAAELVAALLRTYPRITVLCTSRESLGVPGEMVWRVPSLTNDDAVALFRARAVVPVETEEAAAAVCSACARLDGIPLAVELAAAWSDTLSPQEILGSLDDRFSLLNRSPRGVSARHQTLAASMAWSHDLLGEADRVLFRRLGAFHGSFTMAAARQVCAYGDLTATDVLAGLSRLVRKSLVNADTRDSESRYRMLETVRQYAVSRLVASAEYDQARQRQLDSCLSLAQDCAPILDRDQSAWHARMSADYENLRAAAKFGLKHTPERGRRLVAELPFLWHLGVHGREGLALLHEAAAKGADQHTILQARILVGIALVADTTEPLLEHDAAQAALAIARQAGDRRTGCLALILSAVGSFYTDLDAGWRLAEEALTEAEEIGYRYVQDGAAALMGIIMHLKDEHERAAPLLDGAIERLLARGERGIASTALGFLALAALYTGDVSRARRLATRAVVVARPLADHHRVGSAHGVLATVECAAGRIDSARAVLEPVMPLVDDADETRFVPGLVLQRRLGFMVVVGRRVAGSGRRGLGVVVGGASSTRR